MNDMNGGKPKAGTPALARLRTVRPVRRHITELVVGTLSRRAALLAPLVLAGWDTIDSWSATKKHPLPGKREPLGALRRAFNPDETAPKVELPPPVRDMAWPQAA